MLYLPLIWSFNLLAPEAETVQPVILAEYFFIFTVTGIARANMP